MSVCLSVHLSIQPSLHMEQFVSHWMNFYEIWYLNIFFPKYVEKIQVSLKSDT
jgi:hypothetical protein